MECFDWLDWITAENVTRLPSVYGDVSDEGERFIGKGIMAKYFHISLLMDRKYQGNKS